jgi:hypothetical protein
MTHFTRLLQPLLSDAVPASAPDLYDPIYTYIYRTNTGSVCVLRMWTQYLHRLRNIIIYPLTFLCSRYMFRPDCLVVIRPFWNTDNLKLP